GVRLRAAAPSRRRAGGRPAPSLPRHVVGGARLRRPRRPAAAAARPAAAALAAPDPGRGLPARPRTLAGLDAALRAGAGGRPRAARPGREPRPDRRPPARLRAGAPRLADP